MQAILLFSAVLHVGALALATAYILPAWHDSQGRGELTVAEGLRVSAFFGLAVGLVAAVLMRIAHPLREALPTGIVAGMIAAILLALFSQIRPAAAGPSGQAWHQRPQIVVFYGTFALLELLAVSFLITALTTAAGH